MSRRHAPGRSRRCGASARGDTLVEILVAMTVIAIAFVAVLDGLISSISTSGSHRSLVNLDALVRSFAETVRQDIQLQPSAPLFAECATPATYAGITSTAFPSSGPPGTGVAVFQARGGTALTGTAPSPHAAGVVSVPVSNGSTTTTASFTIAPSITTISHTGGPAGTSVSASVIGFAASKSLSVTVGTGPARASGRTDASGSASLSFTVPSLGPGKYPVLVSDGPPGAPGTDEATSSFTVTSSGSPGRSSVAGSPVGASPYAEDSLTIARVQYWSGSAFGTTCHHAAADQLQLITVSATAPGGTDAMNIVVADPTYVPPQPEVTAGPVIAQATGAVVRNFVRSGAGYYVYADVTAGGGPAVFSVSANVSPNVTRGQSAVPLTAGTFTAPDGTSYNYRSGLLTSNARQPDGRVGFTVTATNTESSSETYGGTVTFDSAPPTGSIAYLDGFTNAKSTSITFSATDSGSGLDPAKNELEESTATLSNGACGPFGAFTQIGPTGVSSPYDATLTNGTCDKFEYVATDNVGNVAYITSTSIVKDSTTPPANNLTLSNQRGGGSYLLGTTVYYRGSVAGSFTITDALSSPAGGASAAFPALGRTTAGWTHVPSTVTVPAGGPYVSTTFSWAAGTTGSPTEVVTGTDNAGNSSSVTLSFVNDSTPPRGSINYPNGAVTGGSTYITFSATDSGSGVDATHGQLAGAAAPLSGGRCGSFGGYSQLGPTGVTSPYDAALTNGTCYRFEYLVPDNVGNVAVITSKNVVEAT